MGVQERHEVNHELHELGRAGLILEADMYLIFCGLNLNLVLWL